MTSWLNCWPNCSSRRNRALGELMRDLRLKEEEEEEQEEVAVR